MFIRIKSMAKNISTDILKKRQKDNFVFQLNKFVR